MATTFYKRGFEVVTAYLSEGIKIPQRKTALSAGYDIECAEDTRIAPNELVLIPTGLKAHMQPDEYLGLHIRSGTAIKRKLMMINSQGIIDSDYYNNSDNEGHIMIPVLNLSTETVYIKKGERIAQGIFYNYLLTGNDNASVARTGGFGSTGTL